MCVYTNVEWFFQLSLCKSTASFNELYETMFRKGLWNILSLACVSKQNNCFYDYSDMWFSLNNQ